MKWFQGSIEEAVARSKAKKAIFVVFVDGKDEASVQVSQAIESSEISSCLEREEFVAIRIESSSETYRLFAQIYQLVPVPSIFFIGENGIPLEVIADMISIPNLAAKINDILVKSGKSASGSSLRFIQSEQKTDASVSVEAKKDNNVPIPQEGLSKQTDETVKELSHEEKVKRAKQLMELQKQQRVENEMKEEERELERRKRERELQELRLKQRELEIRQSQEERIKEKAADAVARERVRQQIAQDKLMRKEREQAMQKITTESKPEKQVTTSAESIDISMTRIQFRLPSGNTHMGKFEPSITLGELRNYVVRSIELPFQEFILSTSFPRRDLLSEDDSKTLTDLGLVPTSVILILPLKNRNDRTVITSSGDMSFLSRIIWSIFTPIIGVYNYVMRYFFGSNRNSDRQQNDASSTSETTNRTDENISRNIPSLQQPSGLHRRNLVTEDNKVIRTQGNIHRLHSSSDDNDENNTWNGNSTQQM